jgi:Predicted glutathione S-transferase
MGQLIDGVWHDTWYDTKSTGGRFKRTEAVWRNWITQMAVLAPPARRVSLPSAIAIIFMFLLPVRGHTARC